MSTIDVDAYYSENEILKKAIENTGKKFGLNADWLNCDFVKTPSFTSEIMEKAELHAQFGQFKNSKRIQL